MAIQSWCPKCRCACTLSAKQCPRCGDLFVHLNRKYRVVISASGRRVTKVFESLTLAREAASAIKADILRGEYEFKRDRTPTLGEVWTKYLPWARENKKTWHDDQYYYDKHIAPRFAATPLDKITVFDLEKI